MAISNTPPANDELRTELESFLSEYYREDILELARLFPNEQQSIAIDWRHLMQWDVDVADDYLEQPAKLQLHLDAALCDVDVPVPVDFEDATVRVESLPDTRHVYPGGFSPTDCRGEAMAIEGEVARVAETHARVTAAEFECLICGTHTRVEQRSGTTDDTLQEPHECDGCERNGPFEIDWNKSDAVDEQFLRLSRPPELSDGGDSTVDVVLDGELTGQCSIGDRIRIDGVISLEPTTDKAVSTFEPILVGRHIDVLDGSKTTIDIDQELRQQVLELLDDPNRSPLEIAADALAPKVYGLGHEKMAVVASLVAGGPNDTSAERTTPHTLLVGDPSTGKSQLIKAAMEAGWRTVKVSAKRASASGLTATATKDDFGSDGWTLKAGSFVRADGGSLLIDELDDMSADDRAAMNEPMEDQSISPSLAGQQATFPTRASVIAAANPDGQRIDPYEPIPTQFTFGQALLQRFDLIFVLTDDVDEDRDRNLADHALAERELAKRGQPSEATDVDRETLEAWLALASQHAPPPMGKPQRETIRDRWLSLRGLREGPDDPMPVTTRLVEGLARVAEAIACLELADEVTDSHVDQACQLVGASKRDIGMDQDGNYDADIRETGSSMSQRDRRRATLDAIAELCDEADGSKVKRDAVYETLEDRGHTTGQIERDLKHWRQKGEIYTPDTNHIMRA